MPQQRTKRKTSTQWVKDLDVYTFKGTDGKESCADCQRLKGQSHPASWWREHHLIPKPGNKKLACGGYRCRHRVANARGQTLKE